MSAPSAPHAHHDDDDDDDLLPHADGVALRNMVDDDLKQLQRKHAKHPMPGQDAKAYADIVGAAVSSIRATLGVMLDACRDVKIARRAADAAEVAAEAAAVAAAIGMAPAVLSLPAPSSSSSVQSARVGQSVRIGPDHQAELPPTPHSSSQSGSCAPSHQAVPMETEGDGTLAAAGPGGSHHAAAPASEVVDDDDDEPEVVEGEAPPEEAEPEIDVMLEHNGLRLWLLPGSKYHQQARADAAAAAIDAAARDSVAAAPVAASSSDGVGRDGAQPYAPTKRSARVADRHSKERDSAKAALEWLIRLPMPGLPAAAGSSGPGSKSAAAAAAASAAVAAAAAEYAALPEVTMLPPAPDDMQFSAVMSVPSVAVIGAVEVLPGGADDDEVAFPQASVEVIQEERQREARRQAELVAEKRAAAKAVLEEERRRQVQLASEIAEEMAERHEEVRVAISRAERLSVDPAVLAQAHECLVLLASSMRSAKSSIKSSEAKTGVLTPYRGVYCKKITLSQVAHRMYEAFYETRYLGIFAEPHMAAAAYAAHVLATFSERASEADPFAKPEAKAEAKAETAQHAASAAPAASATAGWLLQGSGAAAQIPPSLSMLSRLAAAAGGKRKRASDATIVQLPPPKKGKAQAYNRQPAAKGKATKQSWTQRSIDHLTATQSAAPAAPSQRKAPAAPKAQAPLLQPPPQPVPAHAPPPAASTPSKSPSAPGPSASGAPCTGASCSAASSTRPAPRAQWHPTVPGKVRVPSADVGGVSAGEKIFVRLPDCEHMVKITWPAEVKQFLTFPLANGCPQCRAQQARSTSV